MFDDATGLPVGASWFLLLLLMAPFLPTLLKGLRVLDSSSSGVIGPHPGGLSWRKGRAGKEGALDCPGAALTVPGWENELEQNRDGKKAPWPHSFTP